MLPLHHGDSPRRARPSTQPPPGPSRRNTSGTQGRSHDGDPVAAGSPRFGRSAPLRGGSSKTVTFSMPKSVTLSVPIDRRDPQRPGRRRGCPYQQLAGRPAGMAGLEIELFGIDGLPSTMTGADFRDGREWETDIPSSGTVGFAARLQNGERRLVAEVAGSWTLEPESSWRLRIERMSERRELSPWCWDPWDRYHLNGRPRSEKTCETTLPKVCGSRLPRLDGGVLPERRYLHVTAQPPAGP